MKMKMNRFFSSIFLLSVSFVFISCKSFGGIQKEISPLDYSDSDVLENERKRISDLMMSEPVEAYWRSILLGDEKIMEECANHLEKMTEMALEEKNYASAWRYSNSLEVTGYQNRNISFLDIEQLFKKDVPGFQKNNKVPASINEAVKATVTVIVDKGIKITYGMGLPDKVLGSGFFIDERGYIVTNHHVIADMVDPAYEGYSRLYIKLPGNGDDKIPAKVIGWDSVTDLALLKTEYIPEYVLNLGSSSELVVGDQINVIGAPLGLEGTLTSGIVSNTKRKLFSNGDVFQIDASVNSGNSGGPCIDKDMKVQAVVFAGVLQAQGLNFAIPVEYLKQELPFMYAGGEYNHSWIGCFGRTKRNGGKKLGAEIQYVMPGSPARLSGLKKDQVITSVNGEQINSVEDLQGYFRSTTPGTIVKLEFEEEEKPLFVYLTKRNGEPAREIYESDLIENTFLPLFGMQLIPASTTSRNTYKIDYVIEGSEADELQFSENDPLTIKDLKVDKNDKYILVQIVTKRHKKNLFDVTMVMGTSFDGPNYF